MLFRGAALSQTKTNGGGKFRGGTKKRGDKERQRPQNIIYKGPWSFQGVSTIEGDAELMGVDYRKHVFSYLFNGGDSQYDCP